MNVTKCDICKKEIKDSKIAVRVSFKYEGYDLSKNCNIPFVKLLEKHKPLKKDEKSIFGKN